MSGDLTLVLESILADPSESRQVEFKAASAWEAVSAKAVKSALAMANLPGNGYFIVGVAELDPIGYDLTGLTKKDSATFNTDLVKDHIAQYLAPTVELDAQVVILDGRSFFVLEVGYSSRRPVKALKGIDGVVDKGKIYFRPKGPRPQSRVATPEDIEDLAFELTDAGIQEWVSRAQRAGLFVPGTAAALPPEDGYRLERKEFGI